VAEANNFGNHANEEESDRRVQRQRTEREREGSEETQERVKHPGTFQERKKGKRELKNVECPEGGSGTGLNGLA